MKTLRDRFEHLLKAAGGPTGLAKATGIDPRHISMLQKRLKETPDAELKSTTLRAIAVGSKVSVDWLLGVPSATAALERGRWRVYALSRPAFARAAEAAFESGKYTDGMLDMASDALGPASPTADQSRAAIIAARGEVDQWSELEVKPGTSLHSTIGSKGKRAPT